MCARICGARTKAERRSACANRRNGVHDIDQLEAMSTNVRRLRPSLVRRLGDGHKGGDGKFAARRIVPGNRDGLTRRRCISKRLPRKHTSDTRDRRAALRVHMCAKLCFTIRPASANMQTTVPAWLDKLSARGSPGGAGTQLGRR